jgi:hypothetical protein
MRAQPFHLGVGVVGGMVRHSIVRVSCSGIMLSTVPPWFDPTI